MLGERSRRIVCGAYRRHSPELTALRTPQVETVGQIAPAVNSFGDRKPRIYRFWDPCLIPRKTDIQESIGQWLSPNPIDRHGRAVSARSEWGYFLNFSSRQGRRLRYQGGAAAGSMVESRMWGPGAVRDLGGSIRWQALPRFRGQLEEASQ